ncbi:hypothetical protein KBC75_05770 [Candidatus Shapirobacteria bacterium]|nr:hypothetical protein [Candidatus Shapirobacteria bacterium]
MTRKQNREIKVMLGQEPMKIIREGELIEKLRSAGWQIDYVVQANTDQYWQSERGTLFDEYPQVITKAGKVFKTSEGQPAIGIASATENIKEGEVGLLIGGVVGGRYLIGPRPIGRGMTEVVGGVAIDGDGEKVLIKWFNEQDVEVSLARAKEVGYYPKMIERYESESEFRRLHNKTRIESLKRQSRVLRYYQSPEVPQLIDEGTDQFDHTFLVLKDDFVGCDKEGNLQKMRTSNVEGNDESDVTALNPEAYYRMVLLQWHCLEKWLEKGLAFSDWQADEKLYFSQETGKIDGYKAIDFDPLKIANAEETSEHDKLLEKIYDALRLDTDDEFDISLKIRLNPDLKEKNSFEGRLSLLREVKTKLASHFYKINLVDFDHELPSDQKEATKQLHELLDTLRPINFNSHLQRESLIDFLEKRLDVLANITVGKKAFVDDDIRKVGSDSEAWRSAIKPINFFLNAARVRLGLPKMRVEEQEDRVVLIEE